MTIQEAIKSGKPFKGDNFQSGEDKWDGWMIVFQNHFVHYVESSKNTEPIAVIQLYPSAILDNYQIKDKV
jgi:hypothetical protein